MHTYEVQFHLPGRGTLKDVVQASNEYDARRLIEARYGKIQIFSVRKLN